MTSVASVDGTQVSLADRQVRLLLTGHCCLVTDIWVTLLALHWQHLVKLEERFGAVDFVKLALVHPGHNDAVVPAAAARAADLALAVFVRIWRVTDVAAASGGVMRR